MSKELLSKRQAVSMMALFIIGSSMVLGISRQSKQDAWIGFLVAVAVMMPILYIYSRILHRYPGKDVFDISIDLFGKIGGRIVIALFALHAFYLGAMILNALADFIQITAFDQMPKIVSLLCLSLLMIWIVRRGVETLGRWSTVALPIHLVIVFVLFLLLIKDMHPSFLLPVGQNLNTIPNDAWSDFSFPLAQSVLFLGVLNTMKPEDKPGKAMVVGILIGGATLLFGGYFRNTMVLGFPLYSTAYYPSYLSASVIIVGSFISRIDNLIGANLLIAGFVKISICLLVAAKGTAKLMNASDYRVYVAPLSLLMIALASILYQNVMQQYDFLPIYNYFAFPFEVIIPILLCVAAEIKFLRKSKKEAQETTTDKPQTDNEG